MSFRILPTDIEEMLYPYSSERDFEILTQLNPFFLNLRISDSNSGWISRIRFRPSTLPILDLVTIPFSLFTDRLRRREPFNFSTIEFFSKSLRQERTLRIRTDVGVSSTKDSGDSEEIDANGAINTN